MLRYLQKFRLSNTKGENKISLWALAVGEFVLVFLGILIALQVDNWNQNRQDRKLERILLSEMLVNLKADLEDVETNLRIHDSCMRSSRIIIDYIDGHLPYHDSLEFHFGSLNYATVLNENISAFESLKSIGIDLIRNDSLRQQICHLYAVTYDYILSLQDLMHNHTIMQLNPAISENILTIEFANKAVPLDTFEIRTNNSLRHAVIINIGLTDRQLKYYRIAKELIINLIYKIEKELL